MATLPEELRKLIPMLSSDNAGEADNARRAIDRILKKNKLDWHDLTKAAMDSVPADLAWKDVKEHVGPWWHVMAQEIEDSGMELTPKETDFVSDMGEWRSPPSERQEAWLRKLHERSQYWR